MSEIGPLLHPREELSVVINRSPPLTAPFFYRIVTEHEKPELLTALLDMEPKVPYLVLRTTPAYVYGITRLIRFTDDGHCVMLYCENFTELSNSPIRTPEQEADYVRALYLKHTTAATAVTSI